MRLVQVLAGLLSGWGNTVQVLDHVRDGPARPLERVDHDLDILSLSHV